MTDNGQTSPADFQGLGEQLARDVPDVAGEIEAYSEKTREAAELLDVPIPVSERLAPALSLSTAAGRPIWTPGQLSLQPLAGWSTIIQPLTVSMVSSITAQLKTGMQARRVLEELGSRWQSVIHAAIGPALQALRQIDWNGLQASVAAMVEAEQRTRVRRAFASADLLPSPSMPSELTTRVVELYMAQSGPAAVSNAVSGRYARERWLLLSEVYRGWSRAGILAPRRAALEDAAWAMREGRYTLVAPTLVPLIEGIAADYISEAAGTRRTVRHNRLQSDLANTIPQPVIAAVGIDAILAFLDFIEDRLFEGFDFEAQATTVRRHSILNRHVLLHGRGLSQASRMNGLRSFLLLDVLGAVVVASEGS